MREDSLVGGPCVGEDIFVRLYETARDLSGVRFIAKADFLGAIVCFFKYGGPDAFDGVGGKRIKGRGAGHKGARLRGCYIFPFGPLSLDLRDAT